MRLMNTFENTLRLAVRDLLVLESILLILFGVPDGIRTRVIAVKEALRCSLPLNLPFSPPSTRPDNPPIPASFSGVREGALCGYRRGPGDL